MQSFSFISSQTIACLIIDNVQLLSFDEDGT